MSNNLEKFSEIVESGMAEADLISLMRFSQSLPPDKFDEFMEIYQKLELRGDRLEKNIRFNNICTGLGLGMMIGTLISLALISFNPGTFQPRSQVNFTVLGLSALIGSGGAAIGSVKKRKH